MERQIKYIVQVQCEPLLIGLEDTILKFLSDYFNVTECSVDNQGMTLALKSNHLFRQIGSNLVKSHQISSNLVKSH